MLLTIIDPDLLVYKFEEWKTNSSDCFIRFKTLALHRNMVRKYDQEIAMSDSLANLLRNSFPWSQDYKNVEQLRDLRQFILVDLGKARYIKTKDAKKINLKPSGIVCQCVESQVVVNCWKELLCCCMDEEVLNEFNPQIATWETPFLHEISPAMTITIIFYATNEETKIHNIPFVWDKVSWYKQLDTIDWWPDLWRCVKLCYENNPAMKNYDRVRRQPIPFKCTKEFWNSVNQYFRDENSRSLLIKSLAKKVYGICDRSLGDEQYGERRRFRVTSYWRVHYREEDDGIVLEEFIPHNKRR